MAAPDVPAWLADDLNDPPDSDDEADPEKTPHAAVMGFLDILLDLYYHSKISAMTLCVICYYATWAGMNGVKHLAHKPRQSSGEYQRYLD